MNKKLKICILGDSVAKGVVYDDIKMKYRFIKNSFVKLCSERQGMIITDLSKFGCTVTKGEEILDKNIEGIKNCDYAVLEFGGNDCNYNWKKISENPMKEYFPATPPDIFEEKYKEIIKKVRKTGCIPVMLSLPPIDEERFFEWISKGLSKENIMKFIGSRKFIYRWHEMYNNIIFDTAQKEKVKLIDIRKIFLAHRDMSEFICSDGMHPNEKGHCLISHGLLDGEGITAL